MSELDIIGTLGETLTAQFQVIKSMVDGVNLKIQSAIENTELKQLDQAINLAYSTNATDAYIATLMAQRDKLYEKRVTSYLIVFIVIALIVVTLIKKK